MDVRKRRWSEDYSTPERYVIRYGGRTMSDILFHHDNYIFSYRVSGILVCDGKVLLQAPKNTGEYAFIGGHVALGETNAETLMREARRIPFRRLRNEDGKND